MSLVNIFPLRKRAVAKLVRIEDGSPPERRSA
jgi:hypothetical protein